MQVDFIIVGAGIAGCSLGLELHAAGKTFLMVDMDEKVTGSKVAAGLSNPIVPKGVKKTWNCDAIFPGIESWYRKWEQLTGKTFYTPFPYTQVFANENMQSEWSKRMEDPAMYRWISPNHGLNIAGINTDYGHCAVNGCGRLDVDLFCKAAIEIFKVEQHVYIETFEHDSLILTEKGVVYKEFYAGGVVFCEGIRVLENPYFNSLPFIPVAGDILELRIPGLVQDRILKNGNWLIPLGEGKFLAGSNYHPGSNETAPVIDDGATILRQLRGWIHFDIELLNHRRGVRPTVQDRRPFLGRHPQHRNVYIFNGLGSKGVSLCSWLAPMMRQFLLNGLALPAEVGLQGR